MKAPTARQLKFGGVAALVILAIAVILQNTEAVETKLLVVSVSMPRAVLLIVTLLIGIALGVVLASRFTFSRRDKKPE